MTFGEKLQTQRQRADLSQDALAERLAVSRQAVSRWERNETMPETEKVVQLADLFGVTCDYLLRDQPGEESAQREPPRTGKQDSRDVINGVGHWLKTKWYLLGWVLVVWGGMDVLRALVIRFAWGSLAGLTQDHLNWWSAAVNMPLNLLWISVAYGALKIIGGIAVAHFGKKHVQRGEKDDA